MHILSSSLVRTFQIVFHMLLGLVTVTPVLASIISNGNFEGTGVNPWYAKGGGILTQITTGVYEGSGAAQITGRSQAWNGPAQNILSSVQAAGPGTYGISLRAKNISKVAKLKPTIRLKSGGVNKYQTFTVSVGTSWGEVSGNLELTWNGTLEEAEFYVAGENVTESFAVDAISINLDFVRGPDWYVKPSGSDSSDGMSIATAFQTIQAAVNVAQPGDVINVLSGIYKAPDYDSIQSILQSYITTPFDSIPTSIGSLNPTKQLVSITADKSGVEGAYITLRAYPGDAQNPKGPVNLFFNGSNGVSIFGASYYILEGLDIKGSTLDISYSMADRNRTARPRSDAFAGNGIAIRNSHHIIVRDCLVTYTPGSGIRTDNSDYVVLEDNVVGGATWWTPSASSAMVVASSSAFDNNDGVKFWIRRNMVHSSWNTQIFSLIERDPNDTTYGGPMHHRIDDGQGIYTTRNNGAADVFGVSTGYEFGAFQIENNLVFNNGYGGLTYHKTNRGLIRNNTIIDNGVFPPDANRVGSNFNQSEEVDYFHNVVLYKKGNPHYIQQTPGLLIANNVYVGPPPSSANQQPGNIYLNTDQRLATLVNPDFTFGAPIGDARMIEKYGEQNIPRPVESFSFDFAPKVGGQAANTGDGGLGSEPTEDYWGNRRSGSLDRGAIMVDSAPLVLANPIDARYLLVRPVTEPGYVKLENFTQGGRANNLLNNVDFETNLTYWSAKGSGTVAVSTEHAYFNQRSVKASNRTQIYNSPKQIITTSAMAAGPGTYRISAYVRNVAAPSEVKLNLRVTTATGTQYFFVAGAVGTDWTLVSGEIPVFWTNTATEVEFYLSNPLAAGDFYVDLPRVERVVKIEAEDVNRVTLMGAALASGTVITNLMAVGDGIAISAAPAAKNVRIMLRNSSAVHGTISVYTNGAHLRNLYLPPSGAGAEVTLSNVNLATGSNLTIRRDKFDTAFDIDYIIFEY